MWEFKEEIKNPSVYGKVPSQFLNEDGDYDCKKAIIEWELGFEMREFGVKDTYIYIKKVILVFDDWDCGSKSYIIDAIDTDFEFATGWYRRDNLRWLTIFPVEIWVDLDDKKVEIEF